jgi:membrane protein DedA with SNARE-associated domain
LSQQLAALISAHGYWIVVAAVALESMGIPVPGETALVTAAIFAGTTHRLNIAFVIVAAASGAIVGDNIGYLLGRRFGYTLLLRYGRLARIDASRVKLGQYVFARHGAKVVFFGRFVAVLRALAAVLAGINCMGWRRFLVFNASGGVVWAAGYGLAAYVFGERLERVRGPVGVIGLVLAAAACAGGVWWMRRHEAAFQAEAERALPGPLRSSRHENGDCPPM